MKYYAVEKKNEENLYELIWNDLRTLLRKKLSIHLLELQNGKSDKEWLKAYLNK